MLVKVLVLGPVLRADLVSSGAAGFLVDLVGMSRLHRKSPRASISKSSRQTRLTALHRRTHTS
jgi:hypothetical protein